MTLKLRENCKYGVAVPTSMGVRITPTGGAPVHTSNMYYMQATSAESNVVNISSSLGIKGLVLTNFVKDSPISYFIKSELRGIVPFRVVPDETGDAANTFMLLLPDAQTREEFGAALSARGCGKCGRTVMPFCFRFCSAQRDKDVSTASPMRASSGPPLVRGKMMSPS